MLEMMGYKFILKVIKFQLPAVYRFSTVGRERWLRVDPPALVVLRSVSWSLAEFRHNKIVQSPHENYFNICRQHKEK